MYFCSLVVGYIFLLKKCEYFKLYWYQNSEYSIPKLILYFLTFIVFFFFIIILPQFFLTSIKKKKFTVKISVLRRKLTLRTDIPYEIK